MLKYINYTYGCFTYLTQLSKLSRLTYYMHLYASVVNAHEPVIYEDTTYAVLRNFSFDVAAVPKVITLTALIKD